MLHRTSKLWRGFWNDITKGSIWDLNLECGEFQQKKKIQVKFILEQATKSQMAGRGIALLFP